MQQRTRISVIAATILILLAVSVDAVQFAIDVTSGLLAAIPYIGLIFSLLGWFVTKLISIFFIIILFLWFVIIGVMNARTAMLLIGASTLEIIPIPFLSALPAWTGAVWRIVYMVQKEDKAYNKQINTAQQGQLAARRAQAQQIAEEEIEKEKATESLQLEAV